MWWYVELRPLGGTYVCARSWEWSPHDRFGALVGRGGSLFSLPVSQERDPHQEPHLRLFSLQNSENKGLLCKHPVYGIQSEQPELRQVCRSSTPLEFLHFIGCSETTATYTNLFWVSLFIFLIEKILLKNSWFTMLCQPVCTAKWYTCMHSFFYILFYSGLS